MALVIWGRALEASWGLGWVFCQDSSRGGVVPLMCPLCLAAPASVPPPVAGAVRAAPLPCRAAFPVATEAVVLWHLVTVHVPCVRWGGFPGESLWGGTGRSRLMGELFQVRACKALRARRLRRGGRATPTVPRAAVTPAPALATRSPPPGSSCPGWPSRERPFLHADYVMGRGLWESASLSGGPP